MDQSLSHTEIVGLILFFGANIGLLFWLDRRDRAGLRALKTCNFLLTQGVDVLERAGEALTHLSQVLRQEAVFSPEKGELMCFAEMYCHPGKPSQPATEEKPPLNSTKQCPCICCPHHKAYRGRNADSKTA